MFIKNYNQLINNVENIDIKNKRKDILDILLAAIEAVDPYKILEKIIIGKKIVFNGKIIDTENFNNIYLVGFGKASIKMGSAIVESLSIEKGILITNEKYNFHENNFEIYKAGHPIPDQNSIYGTNKILDLIKNCNEDDLLIILISGGGSSLLCNPRIPLEDLQITTDLFLRTKMTINEINTIRKHLSFVKGGQLIRCAKCNIISLIISDIINDPIEFIASGPTHYDSTTYQDAKNILIKYKLWDIIPDSTKNIIIGGVDGVIPETLKKDDPIFDRVNNFIVANNKIACLGAERKAMEIGYKPKIITTSLEGEARYTSKKLIDDVEKEKNIDSETNLFITSGETTVKIIGSGIGGRNQEMVLGIVEYINKKNMFFASFATDGVDGNSEAAGALADYTSYSRAIKKNCNPLSFLNENNSYEFFDKIGDLILTGSTGTNVMDIQIVIN